MTVWNVWDQSCTRNANWIMFRVVIIEVEKLRITFSIYLSSYRSQVSVDGLSCMPLFLSFCPQIGSNVLFDAFYFLFENLWGLRKSESSRAIFYYKSTFAYKFYAFSIKTDFRNMSKNLDGKIAQCLFKPANSASIF